MGKILFLLLISLLSLADERGCPDYFLKLNRSISKGFVRPETKVKIQAIFEDLSLMPPSKAEAVFDLVLEDRLRLLDPEDQKYIRDFLKSRVVREKPNFRNQGHSGLDTLKGEILLSVPDSARRTVLEYGILLHEIEHVIQERARDKAVPGKIKKWIQEIKGEDIAYFHREVGAMLAEHEYISSIPLEVRAALKKQLQFYTDPNLPSPVKEFYLRFLDAEEAAPALRVRREHKAGRYNKESTARLDTLAKERARYQVAETALPVAFLGATFVYGGKQAFVWIEEWRESCAKQQKEKGKDASNDPYYREGCALFTSMRKLDQNLIQK